MASLLSESFEFFCYLQRIVSWVRFVKTGLGFPLSAHHALMSPNHCWLKWKYVICREVLIFSWMTHDMHNSPKHHCRQTTSPMATVLSNPPWGLYGQKYAWTIGLGAKKIWRPWTHWVMILCSFHSWTVSVVLQIALPCPIHKDLLVGCHCPWTSPIHGGPIVDWRNTIAYIMMFGCVVHVMCLLPLMPWSMFSLQNITFQWL